MSDSNREYVYNMGNLAFDCLQRSITAYRYMLQNQGASKVSKNEDDIFRVSNFIYRTATEIGFVASSQDDALKIYNTYRDKGIYENDLKFVVRYNKAYEQMRAAALQGAAEQVLDIAPGFAPPAMLNSIKSPEIPHFEVDYEKVMEAKRVINNIYVSENGYSKTNIKFVGCDLEKEGLSNKLLENGFDPLKKTLVIMFGLVSHIREKESVERLFSELSKLHEGSELVFNFHDERSASELKDRKGVNPINRSDLFNILTENGFKFEVDRMFIGKECDKTVYIRAQKLEKVLVNAIPGSLHNEAGSSDLIKLGSQKPAYSNPLENVNQKDS